MKKWKVSEINFIRAGTDFDYIVWSCHLETLNEPLKRNEKVSFIRNDGTAYEVWYKGTDSLGHYFVEVT